jgi:Tfp pilus assembly protein PilF
MTSNRLPRVSPALWIGLVAFLVRFWFLQQLFDSPFFIPIPGGNDRSLYDGLARGVAGGAFFPEGVFMYMPLYPFLLGLVYAVVGTAGTGHLYAAGFLGALIDSVAAGLVAHSAGRLGASARVSSLAGLLYALYPTAIIYSVMTMPNSLNAFLLLLFAYLGQRITAQKHPLPWLGVGLLAGVTALSFAGMLLIAFVGLIYWAITQRREGRNLALRLLLFAAGVALPILPVTLHNWRAEGQFVLVTGHGGFNFYMGNHEGATGYPVQIAGFRGDAGSLLADARTEAERESGRKLTAAEFSQYWSRRAWDYIGAHPFDELKLLGWKVIKFWNRYDYDDMRLLPMLRLTNTAFTLPVWPGFGWIACWGLMGLLMARGCPLAKTIILAGMAGVIGFFITARYRLTFAPLLCVLGAAGFSMLAGEASRLRDALKRLVGFHPPDDKPVDGSGIPAIAAVAVAVVLVAIPLPAGSDFRALDRYNTASYLLACNRPKEALEQARQGLASTGNHADLYFVAGNAFHAMVKMQEAMKAYEAALRINPSHVSAHYNLALVCLELGDPDRAESEIQSVLKMDPGHPRAAQLLREIQATARKSKPAPPPKPVKR